MPNKISTASCVAVLAVGFLVSASPAHAGFEWVAPNDTAAYQPPVATYAPPAPLSPSVATSSPEIISPVIISGDSARNAPPSMPIYSAPAPAASSAPPVMAPSPSSSLPTAPPPHVDLATATISASPAGGAVQGFASQIPLALALRQLLPPGYNFSLDQDVDMNTLVSYRGGKGWRETLADMLAPVGLAEHEQGAAVTISRAGMAPAEPAVVVTTPSGSVPASDSGPVTISTSPASMTLPAAHNDVPSFNVNPVDGWTADRGETLRKVLTDWCRRANVELQWVAEYDYPVEASAHFSGSFEEAVRNLLAGFDGARPQPIGELHTNSAAGQMVLVVQARGNSYSN